MQLQNDSLQWLDAWKRMSELILLIDCYSDSAKLILCSCCFYTICILFKYSIFLSNLKRIGHQKRTFGPGKKYWAPIFLGTVEQNPPELYRVRKAKCICWAVHQNLEDKPWKEKSVPITFKEVSRMLSLKLHMKFWLGLLMKWDSSYLFTHMDMKTSVIWSHNTGQSSMIYYTSTIGLVEHP